MSNMGVIVQNRIFQAFFVLILLLAIIMFAFILNKGFDFTDEGWYLMTTFYPHNYKFQINLSDFNFYTHQLLKISQSVIFLRIVSLSLCFFSILFMVVASIYWVSSLKCYNNIKFKSIFIPLFSISLIFGLLQYQIPMTLNYNAMVAFLTYLVVGIIFLISTNYHRLYFRNIIFIVLGFIIGNLFFIKFTTSILLLILVLGCFYFKLVKLKRLSNYVCLMLGLFLAIVLFFNVLQSPLEFKKSISDWLTLSQIVPASHGPILLWYYLKSLIKLLIACAVGYLVLLCTNFLIYTFAGATFKQHHDILLISSMYSLLFLYFMEHFINYDSQALLMSIPRIVVIFFLTNMFIIFKYRDKLKILLGENLKPIIMVCTLLFMIPFVISFGTVNDLVTFNTLHFAPWAICMFIVIATLSICLNKPKFLMYNMVFMSVIMFITLVSVIIFTPYRLFGNYFQENVLTKIGNDTMYVDKATANFIHDLNSVFRNCGFRVNDYVVPVYDYTGMVFAVGGLVHGCDLYDTGQTGSFGAVEFCSNMIKKQTFGNIFVMVTHKYESNNNMNNISNLQIGDTLFPNDYQSCGSITLPSTLSFVSGEKFIKDFEVYKLRMGNVR